MTLKRLVQVVHLVLRIPAGTQSRLGFPQSQHAAAQAVPQIWLCPVSYPLQVLFTNHYSKTKARESEDAINTCA